jgi:hypothetical protein
MRAVQVFVTETSRLSLQESPTTSKRLCSLGLALPLPSAILQEVYIVEEAEMNQRRWRKIYSCREIFQNPNHPIAGLVLIITALLIAFMFVGFIAYEAYTTLKALM